MAEPTQESLDKIMKFINGFAEKSGTTMHPNAAVTDAVVKGLAMHVEDHPVEYGDFEGVIPEGYGAGIVMLWDRGTWTPESDDIAGALKKGDLKFTLNGYKIVGWAAPQYQMSPAASSATALTDFFVTFFHKLSSSGWLTLPTISLRSSSRQYGGGSLTRMNSLPAIHARRQVSRRVETQLR